MNIDIQKITKTIMRKNSGLQDPQLIHPERDWAIGMVGTLIFLGSAVVFNVWQYHSYTKLSLDEEVILDMVPYKTAQVENALKQYRALSATHNKIISDTSTIVVEEDVLEEESRKLEEESPRAETSIFRETPSLAN